VLFLALAGEFRVRKRPVTVGKTDVQVRMDESLKQELEARAKAEDWSLANLIAYAARCYLNRHTASVG
jgi:hypothetical protein